MPDTVKRSAFDARLKSHEPELKQLYLNLYRDESAYDYFVRMLRAMWLQRSAALQKLDEKRLKDADWYKRRDMLGMQMYTEAFAGTLQGVREKLDYLQKVVKQAFGTVYWDEIIAKTFSAAAEE